MTVWRNQARAAGEAGRIADSVMRYSRCNSKVLIKLDSGYGSGAVVLCWKHFAEARN